MSINPNFDPAFDSVSIDNLFAGDFPRQEFSATISAGVLTRGAVLGRVTAGGEFILSASAAGDGSEVPRAILAKDVDASGGAVVAPIYLTGAFAEEELSFGDGHDADSVRWPLADVCVFIRPTVAE